MTAPTADEIRARHLLPGIEAACLILVEHGINTDEIPAVDDALTEDGYLSRREPVEIVDNAIACDRRPWPARRIWRQLQPHLDETRRNLRGEL